jgi:polyhydroxyalkanoate synthesis regulator protein
MAKRNMEMLAAAARGVPAPKGEEPEGGKDELAEVKAQLAALQEKLDKLGG